MAAAMASRGLNVVGVDVMPNVVESFNDFRAPVQEPDLDEVLKANRQRLRATCDFEDAVQASDVTFIIVPTPSEENGAFSLRYAEEAARSVGRALRVKDGYHLVVLTSTVLPGASDSSIVPIIESESGKRLGAQFGYCYSPEFIALGTVIRDFLNPDFVLIGEADVVAGETLERFYENLLEKASPIIRMTCANAELAKLAVNTYVTMKIAFANTLANLCERLPGGDVDLVTAALGLDSRIGSRYLTGALGYGGPCFPRDNLALSHLARSLGVEPLLAESTETLNRRRAGEVVELIRAEVVPDSKISVLGLSYKPLTGVTDESQGVAIAKELSLEGYQVTVYDPVALDQARKELGSTVEYAVDITAALADCDAVVIANPDPKFRALTVVDFPERPQPLFVLDCWRLLRKSLEGNERIRYRAVGLAQAVD